MEGGGGSDTWRVEEGVKMEGGGGSVHGGWRRECKWRVEEGVNMEGGGGSVQGGWRMKADRLKDGWLPSLLWLQPLQLDRGSPELL